MKTITARTYLDAFGVYPSHAGIKGGTVHDFIRESKVEYYGGKCPVYVIVHTFNGNRCVVGGNYAVNGKPELKIHEIIDFASSCNG